MAIETKIQDRQANIAPHWVCIAPKKWDKVKTKFYLDISPISVCSDVIFGSTRLAF